MVCALRNRCNHWLFVVLCKSRLSLFRFLLIVLDLWVGSWFLAFLNLLKLLVACIGDFLDWNFVLFHLSLPSVQPIDILRLLWCLWFLPLDRLLDLLVSNRTKISCRRHSVDHLLDLSFFFGQALWCADRHRLIQVRLLRKCLLHFLGNAKVSFKSC